MFKDLQNSSNNILLSLNNTLSVWPMKNCCCPDDTSIDTMIAWQGQTIQAPFFVHKAFTREKEAACYNNNAPILSLV